MTRQAYYQHFWNASDTSIEEELIIEKVKEIRLIHPAIGTRKLYFLMQCFFIEHQIKMGRDGLFDLLAKRRILVRRKKRSVRTTQSKHWFKKYPNLTVNWKPAGANELWVADITYVKTKAGFLYLSLVTDAYSHKIMGYHIAESLEAIHTVKALKMALGQLNGGQNLIHHSDRGLQYCSSDYVKLLREKDIKSSMTESGDPLENALAERINGTIKNEYLRYYKIRNKQHATEVLKSVVDRYNNQRPHQSIRMHTPDMVHSKNLKINRSWGINQQNPIIVYQ